MKNIQHKWTVLAVGSLVLMLAYGFFGRAYIETLYEGKGPAILQQRVMKHKSDHSLSHYRHKADMAVARVIAVMLLYPLIGAWILKGAGPANARRLLFFLLLGDGVLFQTHFLFQPDGWFDVNVDWGIPQIYQYLKEIAGAVLCFIIYRRGKNPAYLTLGCLMTFMLADDALQYHETVGLWLSENFNLSGPSSILGCSDKATGELLSLAPYVVGFMPVLLAGILKSAGESRQALICFAGLLAAAFFFGAGIDLVADIDVLEPIANTLSVVENTGTMLMMSCVVAYAAFRLKYQTEQSKNVK